MPRFLWTQKQDTGPKPRFATALAFDSHRERVILFGGDSLRSQLFNDTWAWDGEYWTQVADIGPSPRSGHGMAYDSARQCVVLFGGMAGELGLRDTWEWNGEDWTQVANDGPSPRLGHAMAFDSLRNRIVLFGGETPGAGVLGDTWEWDGDGWTQAENTGPSARKSCAAAFDNVRGRFVLFGGVAEETGLGDTWEWDGSSWINVADFGPEPCLGAAMVFTQDRIALFGGLASSDAAAKAQIFGNTWEWNGTHWTQRQDIGPAARWGHAMTFDQIRSRIVLFGGLGSFPPSAPEASDNLFADTWEHIASASAVPSPTPDPTPTSDRFESFVISPPTIKRGERATGTVTLNAISNAPVDVILTVTPNVLLIDGQGGSGPDFPLHFPAAIQSLAFRFRDRADRPITLGEPITITATFEGSSISATVTITE